MLWLFIISPVCVYFILSVLFAGKDLLCSSGDHHFLVKVLIYLEEGP